LNLVANTTGKTQYILSDGSKGSIEYSKSYITVNPLKTTTYTITSINNVCGIGNSSGSATVTVNPVSDKNIIADFDEFNHFPEQYPFICAGATYEIKFITEGKFSTSNKFTGQISDENGENFKDIQAEGTKSPLKIITPDNLNSGINYRVRIIASDVNVSSGTNFVPLIFGGKGPTATLDSTSVFFNLDKPTDIKINLTGNSPWGIRFGDNEFTAKYYDVTTTPFVIRVNPTNSTYYKIYSVFNRCPGKILGAGIVKLELITANEELSDFDVKLFPNPTPDRIIIQNDHFKNTTLQVLDNFGRQILTQTLNQSETILDLTNYTNGQYLLQLQRDNKRAVYKIQKL
jgi:hypothetical protein